MAKKISQETFDEVVRENIEDFDSSAEAALHDAIEQFKKQGIDLSNIDITGGIGRQEILDSIDYLKAAADGSTCPLTATEAVDKLSELCNKYSCEHWERNINLMLSKGGVNSLHVLMDPSTEIVLLSKVMSLLNELSKISVEIRDFFEPGGCERINRILKHLLSEKFAHSAELHSSLVTTISLSRTVSRTENNKTALMKAGVGSFIVDLIVEKSDTAAEWEAVLQEACQLIRGLCVHDDLRKEMSSAYDNGKFFIRQPGMVAALITLSNSFRTSPGVASAALLAARNFITTEEAVQVMAQHGAITLIRDILSCEFPDAASSSEVDNAATVSLVRSAVGLMRNVCADDNRKNKLVADGSLDLLVHTMSLEVYARDPSLMEHAMACLAAISLRSPSNSQRIVRMGRALDIMAATMRRYADRSSLLRQGCLTVRNIAARCPELRQLLLDAGMEEILRGCGRFTDVVDEAYAALRDLGCEVQYVKVSADGTVAPAYEQFGAKSNMRFNPVYDDSDDIQQRIVEEARAPFAAEEEPVRNTEGSDGHVHDDHCHH